MLEPGDGDRGWDVFSLEYQAASPLSTVFTEAVMLRYLRIFNFLWRLKRVEHALSASWKVMKPNAAVVKPGRGNQESAKVGSLVSFYPSLTMSNGESCRRKVTVEGIVRGQEG